MLRHARVVCFCYGFIFNVSLCTHMLTDLETPLALTSLSSVFRLLRIQFKVVKPYAVTMIVDCDMVRC